MQLLSDHEDVVLVRGRIITMRSLSFMYELRINTSSFRCTNNCWFKYGGRTLRCDRKSISTLYFTSLRCTEEVRRLCSLFEENILYWNQINSLCIMYGRAWGHSRVKNQKNQDMCVFKHKLEKFVIYSMIFSLWTVVFISSHTIVVGRCSSWQPWEPSRWERRRRRKRGKRTASIRSLWEGDWFMVCFKRQRKKKKKRTSWGEIEIHVFSRISLIYYHKALHQMHIHVEFKWIFFSKMLYKYVFQNIIPFKFL